MRVTFSQTQIAQIQTAAIIEVELIALIQQCVCVVSRTESDAACGYTTNSAAFYCQSHEVADTFFVRYRCNIFRSTYAQVNCNVFFQFYSATTTDDLLCAQRQGFGSNVGVSHFAGQSGIVITIQCLLVILRVSNYYIVNIDAGNLNQTRIQCACFNQFFYLNYNDTAAVFNSLAYGCAFQRRNFLFKGDVTGFISVCTSDQSNVDGECGVEQIVLTLDVNQLDDVFLGYIVYFTAAVSGVDKCTQTYLCEAAGSMCSDISEQVAKSTLRYVVSFHLVFQSHFLQSGYCCPVTCNISFQQTFVRKVFCTTAIFVTLRTAVNISNISGFACCQESFFYSSVQSFGDSGCYETTCCNGIAVFNQCSSFSSSNNFYLSSHSVRPPIKKFVILKILHEQEQG